MAGDRDDLLTMEEVAEWTGLATPTLYAMRSQGQGPASFKVGSSRGSRIRYRRSSVEAWLRAQEAEEQERLDKIRARLNRAAS
jgi:predicted DNA-binding transcriptional regulator AlpA